MICCFTYLCIQLFIFLVENVILSVYFILFYFLIYLLIMLLQLSHFPPLTPLHPAHPLPSTFPPYSSCPWVILRNSLASTFPTLFLPSPCLFSTYHLCYLFSVPFPPLSPSLTYSITAQRPALPRPQGTPKAPPL